MSAAEILKAEVACLERKYRGEKYPMGLRSRLVSAAREMRREGANWSRVQTELGVRSDTLRRWGGEVASPRSVAALVPVQVVELAAVSVVSPSGWRVEGLSVLEAAALLRSVL